MTTGPPDDVRTWVLKPPWTLNVPVVTITRPQPAVVAVSLATQVPITVRWPPRRVIQPRLPPAPRVIRRPVAPQGPVPLPGGHPLRRPWSPPPRAPRPPA
jgi:hypothetical protein